MEAEKQTPGSGAEEAFLIRLEKKAGEDKFSRDIQASSVDGLMFGLGILINEIAVAAQVPAMAVVARLATMFREEVVQ